MSIFQAKVKSKAMQIHTDSVGSLEYTIKFPPRKKIGITFRRHNEWGIVKVVPAESDIIIGSLLAAVNGKSVLLMKFDDAIQKAAEALTSGSPFEITFLAPCEFVEHSQSGELCLHVHTAKCALINRPTRGCHEKV